MKNKHHVASTPQPKPLIGRRVVVDEVIADLKERKQFGMAKYGTPLMSHNGRNAMVDAYQEALDLCCYLKQALLETSDNSKGKLFGCHVDYKNLMLDKKAWSIHRDCVIDYGKREDCDVAEFVRNKEHCEHWKEITDLDYYEGDKSDDKIHI